MSCVAPFTSMTLITYNGSSHPMVYSNEKNFRKVYKHENLLNYLGNSFDVVKCLAGF